ncbi:MAG: hypothetical protein A3J38_09870 [Gammaproteobacteria bacterium RIFCSPHIGHO2_12_FULL_45_9]|nr:MAG: hypothetical protein A3J38_09870 [Gammaproteobacteria bacterium RIFCSPHIGHO2_12_FULL_45_9]
MDFTHILTDIEAFQAAFSQYGRDMNDYRKTRLEKQAIQQQLQAAINNIGQNPADLQRFRQYTTALLFQTYVALRESAEPIKHVSHISVAVGRAGIEAFNEFMNHALPYFDEDLRTLSTGLALEIIQKVNNGFMYLGDGTQIHTLLSTPDAQATLWSSVEKTLHAIKDPNVNPYVVLPLCIRFLINSSVNQADLCASPFFQQCMEHLLYFLEAYIDSDMLCVFLMHLNQSYKQRIQAFFEQHPECTNALGYFCFRFYQLIEDPNASETEVKDVMHTLLSRLSQLHPVYCHVIKICLRNQAAQCVETLSLETIAHCARMLKHFSIELHPERRNTSFSEEILSIYFQDWDNVEDGQQVLAILFMSELVKNPISPKLCIQLANALMLRPDIMIPLIDKLWMQFYENTDVQQLLYVTILHHALQQREEDLQSSHVLRVYTSALAVMSETAKSAAEIVVMQMSPPTAAVSRNTLWERLINITGKQASVASSSDTLFSKRDAPTPDDRSNKPST